jgi:NAD(P)-dependent dehydrogenase (short-subunit alcohol dehydrogenase family)
MTAGSERGDMDFCRFEDRVAVVVGAGSGIGAEIAVAFGERGAAVVVADLRAAAAGEVAERIVAAGGQAVGVGCDVQQEADVEHVMTLAAATYGRIDVLSNNAAAMHAVASDGDVTTVDLDHWDTMLNTNLRGQVLGCKHVIPHLRSAGGGSIVNMSSAAAMAGDLRLTAYGASKAAVNHLTLSVATQFGRERIRCNAVIPGMVRVPRPKGAGLNSAVLDRLRTHHLTPYVGEPRDIANAVLFLSSDQARFITGHLLRVDGGLTSHHPAYVDELGAAQTASHS